MERNKTNGVYEPKKAAHKAYVRRKYAKYQGMKIVENSNEKKGCPAYPRTASIDI